MRWSTPVTRPWAVLKLGIRDRLGAPCHVPARSSSYAVLLNLFIDPLSPIHRNWLNAIPRLSRDSKEYRATEMRDNPTSLAWRCNLSGAERYCEAIL
jgi:hypothetical protein